VDFLAWPLAGDSIVAWTAAFAGVTETHQIVHRGPADQLAHRRPGAEGGCLVRARGWLGTALESAREGLLSAVWGGFSLA
jgi:hypothetical protein